MPSKVRSRTGEHGGPPAVRDDIGRLVTNMREILKQNPQITNSVTYTSTINAEAAALQRRMEDLQGKYEHETQELAQLHSDIRNQQGDARAATDSKILATRSRMHTARTAADRANGEFLSNSKILRIKQELEGKYGNLTDKILREDEIKDGSK